MEEATIDRILESLFHVLALLHKKMLRMDLGGVTGDLTRLHFGIMEVLSHHSLATSELAKMLSMQKPQMTHLVEQLVNLGIMARHPDARDRRVINLALTDHGQVLLGDMRMKVRQKIKDRLAVLTPDELAKMSAALETLRAIGTKL
jgi:DNA-binding MarR family transcriptional regulator